MLGINFENCNSFGLAFEFTGCRLNNSSFFKLKINNTRFSETQLIDVDFSDTNLNSAVFDNCDLNGALFSRTNLEKADFRTSFNFSIDPETNNIKKAKFPLTGLPGLLDKYDIEIV